jgi:sec-independent protein translocase protein TatA
MAWILLVKKWIQKVCLRCGSQIDSLGSNVSIGPLEIVLLLAIVLLLFGAKRIPEVGGSLGKGIRDFGRGIKGEDDEAPRIDPADESATSRPTASHSSAP